MRGGGDGAEGWLDVVEVSSKRRWAKEEEEAEKEQEAGGGGREKLWDKGWRGGRV